MECDIAGYWSNLWEQIRSKQARFTAIRLLVQNVAAISRARRAGRRFDSEVPSLFIASLPATNS
jgi:hypothetical protein